jgi:ssRNA-specific RNase YbeY (16S rRNA maturation enzyme)
LACPEKELSILLTDDKRIADLNNRYLGRKGPTNVLAFPMIEGSTSEFESPMLGDVVISVGGGVWGGLRAHNRSTADTWALTPFRL